MKVISLFFITTLVYQTHGVEEVTNEPKWVPSLAGYPPLGGYPVGEPGAEPEGWQPGSPWWGWPHPDGKPENKPEPTPPPATEPTPAPTTTTTTTQGPPPAQIFCESI